MRRRILAVAGSAVLLAVLVLGLPLGFAIRQNVVADEHAELEHLALRAGLAVSPSFVSGDPAELPASEPGVALGVYQPSGHRAAGTGPEVLEASLQGAARGRASTSTTGSLLADAVPVTYGERVIAVVRVSTPWTSARQRIWLSWAGLAGLGLLAAGCALALAAWQSRRLTRPLTELETAARRLGDGDFSHRLEPSSVPEIDVAGAALNRTARRLEDTIERERTFNARASHQLRTPLTQLRLELETALASADPARLRTAAESSIAAADRLEQTIDDVLALARGSDGPGTGFEVEAVLEECRAQWAGPLAAEDRPFQLVLEEPLRAAASLTATRQILHVLLDNAYRHGTGRVTVRARPSSGAVAIDVIDQGRPGHPGPDLDATDDSPAHLGLPMARSLAVGQGGRLLHADDPLGTRLTLLLPASPGDPPRE